jgi:lipopolysaccharide/colanic/teichoic acid biosynthesis glycosyltransferase
VDQSGHAVSRRLRALPGITGQWQVSGRSSVKGDQAVDHDIDYVDNWRLGLDLSILRRTVRAVLRSDGAY